MEYYKLLNLSREPFSNSPDPELFFRSSRHAECLQKLEIAIRLRRGLCVVRGDVGTGKTTVCRHLLRSLSGDDCFEMHMILDPSYENSLEMLAAVNSMLNGVNRAAGCDSSQKHKEMIKDTLFRKGVQEEKTVVLVVDEGQKLNPAGAEILRELLNYETNDQKLLQIIIFAQNEVDALLESMPNFADRVGLYHRLLPLERRDTEQFIHYRLERSGACDQDRDKVHFTAGALRLVHRMSGGYPRKIINLCHNIMLTLIISGSTRVTPAVVRKSAANLQSLRRPRTLGRLPWAAAAAAAVLVLAWIFTPVLPGPADMASMFSDQEDQQQADSSRMVIYPLDDLQDKDPHPLQEEKHKELAREERGEETLVLSAKNIPAQSLDEPLQAAAADEGGLPESLGHVRVKKDESLWHIAQRVYGRGSQSLLRDIISHNPDISNPDLIHRGQRIRLPALEARDPGQSSKHWIVTGRFDNLDRAYTEAFEGGNDLRVLPVWSPEQCLVFLVVLRDAHDSMQEARNTLAELGDGLDQAEIASMDEGGYYFDAGK